MVFMVTPLKPPDWPAILVLKSGAGKSTEESANFWLREGKDSIRGLA
jgi:hypothetical protein